MSGKEASTTSGTDSYDDDHSSNGSGSGSDYSEEAPYGSEWPDLTPVDQDDGPNPIVVIGYSPHFNEVHRYFRAILRAGEKSERALTITTDTIEENPANYTAWAYRREVLDALCAASGSDKEALLGEELSWSREMTENNGKNYQTWFHRMAILERIGSAKGELEFIAEMLDDDSKNYHAWAHRQWVLKTHGGWEEELLYINSLLDRDIRNNSAWNQRRFVVENRGKAIDDAIVDEEIAFAKSAIGKAVNNESPWNYLRGWVDARTAASLRTWAEDVAAKHPSSPRPWAFLVEVYDTQATPDACAKGSEACKTLVTVDALRAKYWNWRQGAFTAKAI